ncbi:hypothetical protein RRG08_021288 [Elysia crispata]|uniref:Uncharacterized protein n=1 Tax=Elysia crispata TaxID=231223 RepID=A0AAE0ZA66_9GAST|nr:hypothetical protein RRG08_021288 [Elysia crispata]
MHIVSVLAKTKRICTEHLVPGFHRSVLTNLVQNVDHPPQSDTLLILSVSISAGIFLWANVFTPSRPPGADADDAADAGSQPDPRT